MISYKPLWKTLIEKNMKKMDLLQVANISRGTLSKLGKDEFVNLRVIDNICRELDCRIEDVIRYEPDRGGEG